MTYDELRKAPVTRTVARLNPHLFAGVCAPESKPDARDALGRLGTREETRHEGTRYRIVFDIYACRPKDWDNNSIKEIQDCLVERDILPDDNWKIIPEGTIRTHKAPSKAAECTVITIEPL